MNIDKAFQKAVESFQAGNFLQAEQIGEEIVKAQPGNADALHFLGIILYRLGKHDAAIEHLEKALQINPDDAGAYYNLGLALKEKGHLDEALASYQKALHLNPHFAHAHYNAGTALQEKGQYDEAIICYKKALQIDPNLSGVYYNLGIISQEKGQLNEAIGHYRKAIQINPNLSDACNNLGLCLHVKGQLDGAIGAYQKALQIDPQHAKAYYNMGNAFKDRAQIDEAITAYQKALQLNPGYADACSNLGSALQEKGEIDEAITAYQKTLKIDPNLAIAHVNMSLMLLLSGNFEQGWKEYEWRTKLKDFPRRQLSQPMWDGSDITGKTILLHAEQGYGDTMQFIRYAPLVAQRGAKVIIECLRELTSLLRNVEGVHQVIGRGEALPAFDLHCPLLSLPLVFDTTLESIPANIPYLSADPLFKEKWRDKVHADRLQYKIGLVWSGNPQHINEQKRSCSLDIFAPLSRLDNTTFYSLQKGEAAEQAKNPPQGMKLIDYTEDIPDFSDTAAFIENLDLVISVDTAAAHLAGALGKPVWTLLPFVPDWRWLLNRDDSPWYPTMRLFRQPSLGDWESVIEKVSAELQEFMLTRTETRIFPTT
jgi:tetratricopeptide (TPR) repeat protein